MNGSLHGRIYDNDGYVASLCFGASQQNTHDKSLLTEIMMGRIIIFLHVPKGRYARLGKG